MKETQAKLAERLGAFLAAETGDPGAGVTGLVRLGGGSSRENWAFELQCSSGESRPMLLRRDPPAAVADTDRAAEVALLRALGPTPVPSPVVVAADLDGAVLERPAVILERAPGRADRAALRDRDPLRLGPEGQAGLAAAMCDLLADLHRLDPADPADHGEPGRDAGLGPVPANPAPVEIERWQREAQRAAGDEPQPELAYTALWLREHAPPPPERPAIVHGDFRPANVLIHDGALGTLLDWEFAHAGDPAEDLGWYTTPIYRLEHFVPGTWSPDDFLARYEARTGVAVDRERLHFWQVLAGFKLAAIALAALAAFLDGTTDRAAGPLDGLLRAVVSTTRGATGAPDSG